MTYAPPFGRRVVVTGLGAVTPLGSTVRDFWDGLVNGRSGIGRITLFDPSAFEVQIAGEARDFHPEEVIPSKELRRMDRNAQFAVVAATQAVADAGLVIDDTNRYDVGVIFGSAGGGYETLLANQEAFAEKGWRRVSPFLIAHMLPDAASGHIAIALGASGPNFCVASACASGTGSVGEAWETIRRGDCEVVIAGATDAPILPVIHAGFHALRALANDPERPERACRPFDLNRTGFVVGEGAGALVLESLDHALRRGARIYAEVCGYGTSADAHDMVAAHESGEPAAHAMKLALRKGGVDPAEVDYINAHGTGTPLNDRVETLAIKLAFGDHARKLAVSSTKSMTGHLMGAAGAIESVACVLAVYHDIIPPTINYETPDPDCDLDYVPNVARHTTVRAALCNNVGLGGHNAAVIFRKYEA